VPQRDDPIFVVGTGRSGTTLLQALIGSHPRIAAPPETHYFRRVPAYAAHWGDLSDDDVLRRVVEAAVGVPVLQNAGFDVDPIYERAKSGPRTYGGVLDAMMQDFAHRHGKQRWSEKSPLQPVHRIWAHLPEAQVVHIVRDPIETVASNLAKTGVWTDPTAAAAMWRRFTERAVLRGSARGPRYYMRVRYEDLAREPAAVMAVVFAFLGEDFDPQILADEERRLATLGSTTSPLTKQVLQPIEIQQGAAHDLLSRQQRARVAAAVAPIMPALGYAAPPARLVAAGRVANVVFWPGFTIRMLRRRALNKWGSAERRRAVLGRYRDAQLQRRLAKEAARRSTGDSGDAG
jgi:hypothetical protein